MGTQEDAHSNSRRIPIEGSVEGRFSSILFDDEYVGTSEMQMGVLSLCFHACRLLVQNN